MQTFLPYKDFTRSARVLDNKRLGKQRVETMQIMHALSRLRGVNDIRGGVIPWGNHPATKMWLGFEGALIDYQEVICKEWVRRGFNDTCLDKTWHHYIAIVGNNPINWVGDKPRWLGLQRFHSAHRGNLLRKDPEYYSQFGWLEEPVEGYWWPKRG